MSALTPRLEITTKIGCSINCRYCPQNLFIKRYIELYPTGDRELSLDNFKLVVDKLPNDTRIDFSGMSEPWLNPYCTDMILYAYEKGFRITVYTTLAGMTEADFLRIADIPFELFVLHIPDKNGNSNIILSDEYTNLLTTIVNTEKDGKNIITQYSCHGDVHPGLNKIIPENSLISTGLIDRAGNIKTDNDSIITKHINNEIVCIQCSDNFFHNVLLPNGTLLVCCMDYGIKHVLGNLFTQGWDEIHNSPMIHELRSGLKDEKSDILCRDCSNAITITEIYDSYMRYYNWAKDLEKATNNLKYTISNYKDTISKREDTIVDLKNSVEKRDVTISNYKNTISRRDVTIVELKHSVAKRDVTIADKNKLIGEKIGGIVDRDKIIADRDEIIADNNKQIAQQRELLKAQSDYIVKLQSTFIFRILSFTKKIAKRILGRR